MDPEYSISGFVVDGFEGVSAEFTQRETIATRGHNVLTRAKRYGRWHALKSLTPDAQHKTVYQEMLRKEMEILMKLQHPCVEQVMGMEDVPGLGRCIVLEWIDGSSLAEWLEQQPPLAQRHRMLEQLLDALAYVHSRDIVHRDLKPSNIMITGNGHNVKLIDFGLADTDAHAILKQPAGTLRYMAPEQAASSQPDVRNDIYSLGIVMQQMELGRKYNPVIARCLMPIDSRYQSVEELQDDLRRRARRRRNTRLGIAAATVAALISGIVMITSHFTRPNDTANQQMVDSLHNRLERTTKVVDNSLEVQEQMVQRLAALNDSLKTLNAANTTLRNEKEEQRQRQLLINQTIAEGIRRIDAVNAATNLKHHIDTLSSSEYVWVDWNYQSRCGRTKALPEYMMELHNRFSTKELAEIEYALTEYCTNYEIHIQQALEKKHVWIYLDKKKIPFK